MDKRKFLFVSLSGLIGDIAWQVLKEGHDVRYYIEAEKERDIADGFVPKSKDWEKDAKCSDIIVFDDTLGQGAKAQALRAAGKPVIGGTPYADRLEDDRSFGQEQLKSAGVSIIPYEDFDSFDPAIEFVNNGIYPLEFTSRFGYPTISIQQEGMLTPISDFFWDLATGAEPKWRTRSGFQIGIRIVVPPFPFDDDATFESFSKNNAIVFKKPNMEGIHIEDVKEVNGQWLIAGTSGVVLVVVGTGQTMKQAQAQVYSRTKNILIPNMYYRTDIGDRWAEDSDKLHNWGYLR
jgi:phosphoribosylamine-glycine ligase